MQRKITSQWRKTIIIGGAILMGAIIARAQTPTVRSYATRQGTAL